MSVDLVQAPTSTAIALKLSLVRLWKIVRSDPHGWFSVVLEVGKDRLVIFGQLSIREVLLTFE